MQTISFSTSLSRPAQLGALRSTSRRFAAKTPRAGLQVCALLGGQGGGLAFLTAIKNTPHPEKVAKGGEDAWFARIDPSGGGTFAVADGVGGYDEYGVDSGLYSKRFMQLAMERDAEQGAAVDPAELIDYAHQRTKLPGACTAVCLQLDGKNGKLSVANLGDSGFAVVRDGELLLDSPAMQHYFDCPYQLCNPDAAPSDTAADAMCFELDVKEGDIIVAGSDGLLDNVFQQDIIDIVQASRKNALSSGSNSYEANLAAASALSKLAYENSLDETYESPYAMECTKEQELMLEAQKDKVKSLPGPFGKALGGLANAALQLECVLGGKTDDITVLVATVESPQKVKQELAQAAAAAEASLEPVIKQLAEGLKVYEAKEAAKNAPLKKAKPERRDDATFTQEEIAKMDKATLRQMLDSYGMPTSGKLSVLQERLASVACE